MNKLAPLLLLSFFAALPHLHPAAPPAAAGVAHFRAAEALSSLFDVPLRTLNRRIPAAARPAAVRALARLLRAYTEVAAPAPVLVPVGAAAGLHPLYAASRRA